jgi:hypothetical protein
MLSEVSQVQIQAVLYIGTYVYIYIIFPKVELLEESKEGGK